MASLLKTLTTKARSGSAFKSFSTKARDWFMTNVNNLRVNRSVMLKDDATSVRSRFLPGRMYMFFYDPKTKDTLPYYDRFPLALLVGPAPGGYYGLNLHYLHPRIRAILLDRLMEYSVGKDEKLRLELSYDLLKKTSKLAAFKPCFKHYLKSNIRSRMVEVEGTDWETAIFLPTERFTGASKAKVYQDSVEKII
tara:strand:- start:182 stop:763 length:582 start_codon:yes stop_codon:yes gene_type:complete